VLHFVNYTNKDLCRTESQGQSQGRKISPCMIQDRYSSLLQSSGRDASILLASVLLSIWAIWLNSERRWLGLLK